MKREIIVRKIDWQWNIIGSYEKLCSNILPEVTEANEEAEVESTRSDLEASGM